MFDLRSQPKDRGVTGRWRTLSVRVRLIILAVIAITPLIVERVHNEESDRSDRIETARKHVTDVARQGAAEQNQVIVSARVLLQVVATAHAQFNFSDAECGRFLKRIAAPEGGIKTLSIANVLGKIVCSSNPGSIGLDISERPHFTQAIDTAGFVLSDYYPGTRINGPLITLALAQRGANGAAAAVVLGVLDLNWFERVATTFVPPSGSMLMIDRNGTVLAQYPSGENVVGKSFKEHPLVSEMLSRPEGLVTENGLDGVRRIFGFEQLPGTQARIAFGLNEREVLAHADREMWTAFAELSAVIVLVLLGIWFGGEHLLVRPIRALADAASRIGRGDSKTHAAELPLAAEFVPLAVALDDMASRLHAREQDLRDINTQLHELSQVDALTGLGNRRAFNMQLAALWQSAIALRQPVAILMIDVDYFKLFNDLYGHVQGDNCLRKVGGILLEHSRASSDGVAQAVCADPPPSFARVSGRRRKPDFAARYGGEEFAILLQGADKEIALRVAERLRKAVEDMLMAHSGAPWGFVSVSVGVASIVPARHQPSERLTECADAALYEAKKLGRNRVVAHPAMALAKVS